MTTRCTNCGTVLPRDNARFCNKCGVQQASRLAYPGSAPTSKRSADDSLGNKPPATQTTFGQEKSRPALREQIAQQPPARPLRLVSLDKSPSTRGGSFSAPLQEPGVENFPTRPLAPQPPELPVTSSPADYVAPHTYQDEIASFDTAHLAASAQSSSGNPFASALAMRQQVSLEEERPEQRRQWQEGIITRPASPLLPSARRSRRRSLPVISVLLCLLIAVGLGTWIVVSQPFSVPVVTQPQQSFRDSSLGLSLLYPSGWMIQIDRAKATVSLYDSSHTSQVIIIVKDAGTSGPAQYLQQQVVQLGMTGAKAGTPLLFAGETWQLVRGSVQRSGANYTESVLATIHGNHLVTFIQSAPQSIYADEEKLVFSGMRSSLQFI